MRSAFAALGLLCLAAFKSDAAAGQVRSLSERVVVRFAGECFEPGLLVPRIAFWLQAETLDDDIAIEIRGQDQPRFELSFSIYMRGGLLALRRFDDLRGPCADRVDALALSIATTVDPSGVLRGQSANPTAAAKVVPAQASKSATETVQVGTGTWLSQVPVPGGTAAAEFDVTWRAHPRATLTVGVLGTLPSDVPVGQQRARLTSFATRLQGCAWDGRLARLRGALCASVVGGLLGSRTEDVPNATSRSTPWLVAEPRAVGEYALSKRLRGILAVGVPLALRRASLDVLDADGMVVASSRSPWWGLSLAAGIAMVWP